MIKKINLVRCASVGARVKRQMCPGHSACLTSPLLLAKMVGPRTYAYLNYTVTGAISMYDNYSSVEINV